MPITPPISSNPQIMIRFSNPTHDARLKDFQALEHILLQRPLNSQTSKLEIEELLNKLQSEFTAWKDESQRTADNAVGTVHILNYEMYMNTDESCFQLLKSALKVLLSAELSNVLEKMIRGTEACEKSPRLVYELVQPFFEKIEGRDLAQLLIAGSGSGWLSNDSIKEDFIKTREENWKRLPSAYNEGDQIKITKHELVNRRAADELQKWFEKEFPGAGKTSFNIQACSNKIERIWETTLVYTLLTTATLKTVIEEVEQLIPHVEKITLSQLATISQLATKWVVSDELRQWFQKEIPGADETGINTQELLNKLQEIKIAKKIVRFIAHALQNLIKKNAQKECTVESLDQSLAEVLAVAPNPEQKTPEEIASLKDRALEWFKTDFLSAKSYDEVIEALKSDKELTDDKKMEYQMIMKVCFKTSLYVASSISSPIVTS